MRKVLCGALLLFGGISFGQSGDSLSSIRVICPPIDPEPLLVIVRHQNLEGRTTSLPFNIIDPNDIESIDALKSNNETETYGDAGKNGAIIIRLKTEANPSDEVKALLKPQTEYYLWNDLNESEAYVSRHECSFTQIGDKFILFGGREQAQKLELYDYQTDTWTTGARAPKQFNHFQATAYKGFVWVIGAFKTNNFPREEPEENIWMYHFAKDVWIKGPEIPAARRRGGAGLAIYDDKFYVIGGNTIGHDGGYVAWFDEYDPHNNTWTELPDASEERDHFSAAVIEHKLYAAAGRKSGGQGGVFAPLPEAVDVYDFDTKSWSVLTDGIPTPRAAPGVAVFQNKLYIMGGEGTEPGPAYRIMEVYDPARNTWSQAASMNHPRHGTQAIVSGDGIFIAAGSPKRGGGRQHHMEVYGINQPQGEVLTASVLNGPNEVFIASGGSAVITLINQGGNSASFIESASIEGAGFELTEDYNFRLVDEGSEFDLVIKHTSGSSGSLEIISNGGDRLVIRLIVE